MTALIAITAVLLGGFVLACIADALVVADDLDE